MAKEGNPIDTESCRFCGSDNLASNHKQLYPYVKRLYRCLGCYRVLRNEDVKVVFRGFEVVAGQPPTVGHHSQQEESSAFCPTDSC